MDDPHWENSTGLNEEERSILKQACDEVGVPCSVVERMIAAEQQVYGMGRRHLIREALEVLVTQGIEEMEGVQ